MSRVFLDHNATTPPSLEVLEEIKNFSKWGNPSSIHSSGRAARSIVLKTRRLLAEKLNVEPGEIIFTSGGSEANNMALKGLMSKLKERRLMGILSTQVEHPSVYKTLHQMEAEGFKIFRAPVDRQKGLDYDHIQKILKEEQIGLVSIMKANNETGEIFDLKKIRSWIDQNQKEHKIYFHSDMVQTLGKLEVDLSSVDLASFSAHKFYALQGTGFLYQKKGVGLQSLIMGGGQERGRRAGTENVLGLAALGVQAQKVQDPPKSQLKELRDHMEQEILNRIEGVEILAQKRERLCNTSQILIDGVHGETLLINLDLKGYEVSTGAACSSGNPEPSPVLMAMGLSHQEASKSLRVSLGCQTTKEEVEGFVETLEEVVLKIRSL